MGMAIMYAPFFGIAHLSAKLLGYEMDGFSEPYQCMIQFSGLVYMVIGLFFLRKTLLKFFHENVAAFSLFCVLFGSNVFYYVSVHGAMSHAHSFCLASIFIWYSIKWLEKPDLRTSLIIGLTIGLLTLIRPINAIVALFFVLYGVSSLENLRQRMRLFLNRTGLLAVITVCAVLCFVPQLIYWKWVTGHYFFNSYVGEQFFWGQPHLVEGLFGFRKGWLLYSPVMFFSLVGMIMMFRSRKEFAWTTVGLFCIYVYVILSWWCWWYGGAYGMRAMIDIYPFLIIAFAVFLQRYIINRIIVSALMVLVLWNCFRMFQYRRGVIHYDSMTKEAFFKGLFQTEPTRELEKTFKTPDYAGAMKGKE
jgi:hypothetical protein